MRIRSVVPMLSGPPRLDMQLKCPFVRRIGASNNLGLSSRPCHPVCLWCTAERGKFPSKTLRQRSRAASSAGLGTAGEGERFSPKYTLDASLAFHLGDFGGHCLFIGTPM